MLPFSSTFSFFISDRPYDFPTFTQSDSFSCHLLSLASFWCLLESIILLGSLGRVGLLFRSFPEFFCIFDSLFRPSRSKILASPFNSPLSFCHSLHCLELLNPVVQIFLLLPLNSFTMIGPPFSPPFSVLKFSLGTRYFGLEIEFCFTFPTKNERRTILTFASKFVFHFFDVCCLTFKIH